MSRGVFHGIPPQDVMHDIGQNGECLPDCVDSESQVDIGKEVHRESRNEERKNDRRQSCLCGGNIAEAPVESGIICKRTLDIMKEEVDRSDHTDSK